MVKLPHKGNLSKTKLHNKIRTTQTLLNIVCAIHAVAEQAADSPAVITDKRETCLH